MNYQIKKPMAIDVSSWESDIFWDKLDPMPEMVIARASKHKWADHAFLKHYDGMSRIGVKRGVYHAYWAHDLSSQVSVFLEQCTKAGAYNSMSYTPWQAELAPVFDAEYAPPQPTKWAPKNQPVAIRGDDLAYQYKYWLDAIERIVKVRPIIYTNVYYWSFTHNKWGNPPSWTKDYQFWIAWYPDDKDAHYTLPKSMLPKGVTMDQVVLWQYAEDGKMGGLPYDGVDLNLIMTGGYTPPPSPAVSNLSVNYSNGNKEIFK